MKDIIANDYLLRTDSNTAGSNTYTGAGTYIAQVDGANGFVTLGTYEKTNPLSCMLYVTTNTIGTSNEWLVEFSKDNFVTIDATYRKFIIASGSSGATSLGLIDNMTVNAPLVTGSIRVRYKYIIVGAGVLTITKGAISVSRP